MKYGKKNRVSLNPLDYNICLLGEGKIGKTTMAYEVCEKLVGEDGYLFVEMKGERGADAIEGINYVNCPNWNDEYDELNNTIGFSTLVSDIIENKTEDYPDLKVIVVDTYDYFIEIAEEESIRLYNKMCREKGDTDKITQSINAAWGGYGKGEKKAIALMFDMCDMLAEVGVHVWMIGHVKTKDITDVMTGNSYSVLTSDQQQNYFKALQKRLHFLGLAYIDRTINKDKKVTGESRRIRFRDDNYSIDSGSRFADIIDDIPMDADEFIKALTDAIEAESKKSGKSLTETKKEQKVIEKKKATRVAEIENKAKAEHELTDVIDKIVDYFQEHRTEVDTIKPILAAIKEMGYDKPQSISAIEDAREILALCI